MRLLLQRVSEASVTVDGNTVGSIRTGLLILAGMAKTDTESEVDYLSDKVLGLRIFPDSAGKMNRNVVDAGGSLLIVSQFTLYGDCRKGRRPSFDEAAAPEHAQALYNYFVDKLRSGPGSRGNRRISGDDGSASGEPWSGNYPDGYGGLEQEMIETYGYARAGFLGNPSDGYFGKTLSFAMSNFRARVLLYPSGRLEIKPSKVDLPVFENLDDLYRITRWRGYYGGIRIIQALIVRLVDYCRENGIELPDRNFTLEYESNVPQRLGLGGSSAIITASLRALCQYYELDIPLPVQANMALETETRELNVPAGLTGSRGTGISGAGIYGFLARADGGARLRRVRADGCRPAAECVCRLPDVA